MVTDRNGYTLSQDELELVLAVLEQRVGLTNDDVLKLRTKLTNLQGDEDAKNGRTGAQRRR